MLCVGGNAWADEERTLVYSNDFEESSDWTSNGNTSAQSGREWMVNPGVTTANTFESNVIGCGSYGGDHGLCSPAFSIANDITIVDVEMKFKMDGCTGGKSSGIEFIQPTGVTIGNGYISSGTPLFAISASASGNGYWGTIKVGGNDYTSTLNQTGTFENNNLNRNTTGIVVLSARFNFTTKETTFTLKKTDGTTLVESTTVAFANTEATSLSKIYLHAGKSYGGVTIDDVYVYSVKTTDTYADYTVHFVDQNGDMVKEDETRSGLVNETVNANSADVNDIVTDNAKYVYANDGGGVKVTSDGKAEMTITYTKYGKYTYTVNAVDESNNTLATLATANLYEGETADLVWNKYIQVDGQWYVTSENTFKETATEAGTKDVVYKPADIAYFFEMENLTRTGGAYLTEESASYSGNARLRISKGSTHYTPALTEGMYTLTIGCANSNSSESEVYVYTRSNDGTLSEKLYTHKAPKGNTTLKCDIAVPEGYSIAFNGNEGSYNNNARMDYMILTPAKFEKSISAAGYATLYTDKALDFSETGLKAYVAVENGDEVSFNEVTTIPAETGVLLKGDQGNYSIPVVASADAAESALVGVLEATEVAAPIYVLLNGEQGVGFYKTTAAFTVGANTAYLPGTASARSFIGFRNEATGIKALTTIELDGKVYNMNGQRVAAPQKGLYIVNGKKTIIK